MVADLDIAFPPPAFLRSNPTMDDRLVKTRNYPARRHYRGKAASGYDDRRTATPSRRRKWAAEMAALESMLGELPAAATLLDLPCGTARFRAVVQERGLAWSGGDISLDMLRQVRLSTVDGQVTTRLVCCEAERLPFADGAFDFVLSIRFLNLLPEETLQRVLHELGRVARRGVIAQIRLAGTIVLIDPLLRWLRTDAIPVLMAMFRRQPRRRHHGSRVYPSPSRARFRELAERAGLRLSAARQVGGWRGRTHPDRLKLCLLRPRRTAERLP